MDATERYNVGIGITYAIRHLQTIFLASKLIYPNTWKTDAAGDEHERRRANIETLLKISNLYTIIGSVTVIAGDALKYIYRTDNIMETLVKPAKDSSGDWRPTRSVITKFLDDMEHDLSQVNPTFNQLVPGTDETYWKWDAGREQYYHFDSTDRTYKYHNGMWLRLDGSQTSLEQELELAKAYNLPVQPSLGYQNGVSSVTASMRQLTMGRGEDAGLE